MRNILFVLICILQFCSCKNNETGITEDDQNQEASEETIQESNPSEMKEIVEKRVNEIYSHVFSEYVKACDMDCPGNFSRAPFDSLYLSEDFLHMINRVGDVEEILGGPVCFDADYWIMAQDFGKNLSHKVLSTEIKNSREALVKINIHNFESDQEETVSLVFERGNWYIDNWTDEFGDMRKSMTEALEDYEKEYKNTNTK